MKYHYGSDLMDIAGEFVYGKVKESKCYKTGLFWHHGTISYSNYLHSFVSTIYFIYIYLIFVSMLAIKELQIKG